MMMHTDDACKVLKNAFYMILPIHQGQTLKEKIQDVVILEFVSKK